MSRDPAWRDHASADLMAGVIQKLGRSAEPGRALVVDDPEDAVVEAFAAAGWQVERWDRFIRRGRKLSVNPAFSPADLVAVRLNKSKDVTEMALHRALGVVREGGSVFLYGAKDEGIKSGAARLEPLTGPWATRATGGHARVLGFVRSGPIEGLRPRVQDWVVALPHGGFTYPGVFGGDGVDPGTQLLLDHLPEAPEPPILDFAAGRGVIAAALVEAGKATIADLVLSEVDTLAGVAANLSLPNVQARLEDGWFRAKPWGTVLSNPPYHDGKRETTAIIEELITGAARDLMDGGELRIVVQRRLPVERLLREAFHTVEVIADEGPFRVWSARRQDGADRPTSSAS